jgi:hypothetical protein
MIRAVLSFQHPKAYVKSDLNTRILVLDATSYILRKAYLMSLLPPSHFKYHQSQDSSSRR